MKQTTIEPLPASDLFALSINELSLSTRTAWSIYRLKITDIGSLAKWTREELLKVKGVGKVQVAELDSELRKLGTFLGANDSGQMAAREKPRIENQ